MEIIAEFGVNWKTPEGWLLMLAECKRLGIKYIKMQLFTKDMVPEELQSMTLTYKDMAKYWYFAQSQGIELIFTPMYPEAVEMCKKLGVNYYKIRYVDRWNIKIKEPIIMTNKTTFLSINENELRDYYSIYLHWNYAFPLLCVPKYPATFEDYNNIVALGYSDHTPDLRLYQYAKEHNAHWFEVHVKLDNNCYESKWSKSFKQLEKVLK